MTAPGSWPIAGVPRLAAAYILLVDVAVAAWAAVEVSRVFDQPPRSWMLFVLLTVLALAFEESATRTARIQRRISGQLKRNMTSVWTVAGAIALPTGLAVLLVVAVVVYIWFRQQKPVGHQLFRSWLTASTQVAACLVSSVVVLRWSPDWEHLGWALGGSLSVLIVIAIQTVVNRSLVTVAFLTTGVRGKVLVGSRDDNLIEFATLCLGGLAALAAVHEPWLCILVIAPMVTLQRGALVRELEMAAATDAKTGLLNAVAWEHLTQRELARAAREKYDVAVLIIDIDRFKQVNDRYGHLVGDQVLRTVGKVLEAEVREYDTVGRFGGEEFVAVLPMAGDSDALVIAERLRSRINELRVAELCGNTDAEAAEHVLAVSIGVACSRYDGIEVSDLLVAADAALYRAKSGGRNRVVLADRGTGGTAYSVVAD